MIIRRYGVHPITGKVHEPSYDKGWYLIKCPGCKFEHIVAVGKPFDNGAQWTFNRDMEKPTFSPSINIIWEPNVEAQIPRKQCHFFVVDGKVNFCSDCTHSLAGQQGIPLLELDII